MEYNNPTLEQVINHTEQALCTFYGDTNLNNKNSAHKWLLEVQKLPQAWQVCWRLMEQNKAAEVQFFGASLLHYKITKYWCELPEDHYQQLKSEIIRYILLFCHGPRIVLSRLCIAIAAFAIQTTPHHWSNAVKDLIKIFEDASVTHHTDLRSILIEVVTVLPEEFLSSDFLATRRIELRNELQSSIPIIIEILTSSLSSDATTKHQALRCLITWVRFGLSSSDIDKLGATSIISCLDNEELFDTTIDVLVEITTSPSTYSEPTFVKKYIKHVVDLKDKITRAVQSGDMDKAVGFCRLIVSLGETHSKILLTPHTEVEKQLFTTFVTLILDFTNCPGHYPADEQCSEMTFTFWYTFQMKGFEERSNHIRRILSKLTRCLIISGAKDDILGADPALSAQYKHEFSPLYLGLTKVLLQKCQYPSDTDWETYNSDEKEQFRCYRQDVSDTMMYAYCLLRDECLNILHHQLSMVLSDCSQTTWQAIESILFLIQAVAGYVDPSENTYLPAILALFSKIPSHPTILRTALLMLGSYSDWLKCHPALLKSVIPVLLNSVSDKSLTSSATQALRDICQECSHDLDQESLTSIVNKCQTALSNGMMKDRERIRCMECLGHTLSVQPVMVILSSLERIIAPHIIYLAELSSKELSMAIKPNLQTEIQLFTILFKSLDPEDVGDKQHPVFLVLQQVFPSLAQTGKKWVEDADIIQALCLCLERAITTIRDNMANFVQNIAELITHLHTTLPRSSLLDTAVLLVGMYAKESQHQKVVFSFFEKMALVTLELLQKDFDNNPDIIQSFMHFLSRALRNNPYIVFASNEIHRSCFQCGLSALNRPESHTVKASCGFLVAYIKCCESQEKARDILASNGQLLVNQILQGVGGRVPRQHMDSLAEILLALNINCPTLFSTWLQELLHIENFPSKLVTLKQKQQFKSSILRERIHKRRLKEVVKEFSLLCRGIYGTMYAAS